MKKLLIVPVLLFCLTNVAFAVSYENIQDNERVYYDIFSETWNKEDVDSDSVVVEKRLYEGTNDYSEYFYTSGKRAFALSNGYEFISNGCLVCVDNNNLKFSKIIYNGDNFEEIPIDEFELYKIFPDYDVINLSGMKKNKLFIKKAPFTPKTIVLNNDTDRSFYKLQSVPKFIHKGEIRAIIPVHIGKYKFKHFGERKGRLYIYVI